MQQQAMGTANIHVPRGSTRPRMAPKWLKDLVNNMLSVSSFSHPYDSSPAIGEHQTRIKVLDDNIKAIADFQTTMRRYFDLLASLVEDQRRHSEDQSRLLQEVLAKLNGTSIVDSPGASLLMDSVGFTPLSLHKPAPIQMARFAGDHPECWGWPAFTAAVLQQFHSLDLEEPEGILAKLQ
ncbi:hypothetical protein GOBAR_DD01052 [Gossypium barbadense]|nr:hypothetical protein GOBAR_DD01052 [Gossypium barbadense]